MILPAVLAAVLAATIAAAPSVSAPVAVVPASPEIWRGAHAGMTAAQVGELFPNGHAPPGDTPAMSGAIAGWSMDEEVYGRAGVATFYFTAGRLSSTLVSLKEVPVRSTGANLTAARALATELSGYYGKPKDCVDVSKHSLNRMDCRWSTPGVLVGLSYLDYGGASPTLDLAVQLPAAKPAVTGAVFKSKGHKM